MSHSISKPTLAPTLRKSPRTLVFRAIPVALLFAAASLVSAQSAAPHPAKPHHRAVHARPQAENPAPAPPVQPVEPAAPPAPKWPVNDAPTQPSVTWDSKGLHIAATNSSLSRILAEVSTETGAKIEGLAGDERVFGDFGPGQANDVLSQLLHGSSYDFLLLGDQGQGTPRQVILSPRSSVAGGASNPGMNRSNPEPAPDEESGPESDEVQPVQPVQAPQRPMGQPFNPRAPMTPQERMQQMQQMRQQQLQQQQQQQNQQPPP